MTGLNLYSMFAAIIGVVGVVVVYRLIRRATSQRAGQRVAAPKIDLHDLELAALVAGVRGSLEEAGFPHSAASGTGPFGANTDRSSVRAQAD
jgi:hypothetical protein